MNEIQSSIERFLESYFSFIPDEYWALISLILAVLIVVITFVGRLASAIMGVHAIVSKLFGTEQVNPSIQTDSARVLRQVWLRDVQMDDVRQMPEPKKSIPIGTLAATVLGMVIYIFVAFKL